MKASPITLFATLFFVSALIGCSKKGADEDMQSAADPIAPMAEPLAPPPQAKPVATPIVEEKIIVGIDICDAFLDRYRNCLAQLPSDIQNSMKEGLTNTETALFNAANGDDTEENLREACTHLDENISQAMTAQGCVW